ncbi:MAG: hypothetical protein ABI345_07930 [Jatrophihabitans sp.]
MTSDPQLELRVSRLENDRDSIYDLITEMRSIQHEHTQRFDGVDQHLVGIDQRFDKVDTTLAEVLRRLPSPSGSA